MRPFYWMLVQFRIHEEWSREVVKACVRFSTASILGLMQEAAGDFKGA